MGEGRDGKKGFDVLEVLANPTLTQPVGLVVSEQKTQKLIYQLCV